MLYSRSAPTAAGAKRYAEVGEVMKRHSVGVSAAVAILAMEKGRLRSEARRAVREAYRFVEANPAAFRDHHSYGDAGLGSVGTVGVFDDEAHLAMVRRMSAWPLG